jgi:imidazole glycerol-phosphate synthase subunit HisF
MYHTRVIPCLLLQGEGLVKTITFKNPIYLGDPINIVKIFNDKEVDELVLLDIRATIENKRPQFALIEKIASECFMPLGYGGGIRNVEDMKNLFSLGVEKISINSCAVESPDLIKKATEIFGSQSIVISIDVKKSWLGKYEVVTHGGKRRTGLDPVLFAKQVENLGAGELLLNSVERDGTMQGYDLKLISLIANAVNIPVVACGGAGKLEHLADAVLKGGASAAAAGSFFVFNGPHRAVLISYPLPQELKRIFDT